MSTLAASPRRTGTGLLALVTSFLVVLSGLFIAPAAYAAEGPSATLTVTGADTSGLTAQVDFSGIPDSTLPAPQNMGVYAAIVPVGGTDYLGTGTWVKLGEMTDGAGSTTVTAAASELDPSISYEVLVWYAHGDPTDQSIVLREGLTITPEQWDAVFPPAPAAETVTSLSASSAEITEGDTITLTATVTPVEASGTVAFYNGETQIAETQAVSAGSTNVSSSSLPAGALSLTATFVPEDDGAFLGSTSATQTITVNESEGPAPTLSVSKSSGLNPEGETVTVTGTGYNVDQPIYVTLCTDVPLEDVSFSFIAAGCTQGAKQVTKTPTTETQVGYDADGSFEFEMTVSPKSGSTALYTLANHTAMSDRSQDAKVSLVFADPTPGAKASVTGVSVSKTGIDVKVSASDLPGGIYAALIERGTESQVTAGGGYAAFAMPFPTVTDGKTNFTLAASKTDLDRTKSYEVIIWQQHSTPSANTIYARADVSISETNWDKLAGTTPVVNKPTVPAKTSSSRAAGSLSWGISSAFKAYTTGPIAKGSVSTSGVGSSGGAYLYPQGNGGSWNKTTQTGSIQYSGVVTFTGHGGAMNVSFANPVITVNSATAGSISVNGTSYPLNLGAASKSVGSNGEVSWSNVPVSGALSGGGDSSGSTGGGTLALDGLSFTVGAASALQYGSTTQTNQPAAREAAATAPAAEGIKIVTPAGELVPGGEIELTAPGFEANERDILVVLYSDPIVLDRKAGANADGEVRWIGTLPKDLEPGEHTITLQGSIDAGATITVLDAKKSKTVEEVAATTSGTTGTPISAEIAGPGSGPVWLWWVGAGALILLAGAMGGLVVNQRKVAAASATASDV